MKNYAMPAAIAIVGFGLMSIGFNLNGNTATATPAAFNAGPVEPTIVWYHATTAMMNSPGDGRGQILWRAWSDGLVEAKFVEQYVAMATCFDGAPCTGAWLVISYPNEGLNAAADINFDERVDAADLGQLLAAWGDAPRNDYPPSDCPLGLIP